MTRLEIFQMAIEVTRRCNIKCEHCMRGDTQNINITKSIIDDFFNTKNKDYKITSIDKICFTGGEPTLYPEVIIYTINKIIEEGLPVNNISMVTNGQLFIPELVEAFNRFNRYSNLRIKKRISESFLSSEEILNKLLRNNTNNHVRISFSTDDYHAPVPKKIRMSYQLMADGLIITDHILSENNIIKIGYSKFGKEIESREGLYSEEENHLTIFEMLYITSLGKMLFGGDGSYEYLDCHTIGDVRKDSILSLTRTYGRNIH